MGFAGIVGSGDCCSLGFSVASLFGPGTHCGAVEK